MGEQCPFCWDGRVREVKQDLFQLSGPRRLMECADCEKWYWEDSGKEVFRLFLICETALLSPTRCYPELRDLVTSGRNGLTRRRLSEFNHLCSQCPHRRLGGL